MFHEYYANQERYLDLRREAHLRRLLLQNKQSTRKGILWMREEQTSAETKYPGKSRENCSDTDKIR